ncbi:hypothetical protein B7494_g1192 [Chlorociboria aeruginascens]|nr:hypothetical protein B7494_g1192 [Chlorociboria aeruginascens]
MNNDVEKGASSFDKDSATTPDYASGRGGQPSYEETTVVREGWGRRMMDSFKRDPNLTVTPKGTIGANGRVFDPKNAAAATANSPLARRLKSRHLQMIAIGGSIGTGLFVASGKALAAGGPASVLVCFVLIGIMLYCTVHALGEMAVLFPVAGSFSAYSTRFLDPAWGFAMGWNYALQWLVVLPLEVISASITINYWDEQPRYNHAIFVTIFLVVIISINLFGIKGYGEAEFFFSIIKIIAVIGYILLGIILNCGGGPDGGYIGGKYWSDPGAFNHGFKGLCSVFVTAAFAFAGTELVGLAAAETENPRKSLPTAVKQVFWRITLFYIVSLTLVGLLVPYNDNRLLKGGSANTAASPFVISIENAGITVLPSVMNCVILIAVLSVGNSSIFGSSRTLAALADQGQAPKILGYIDRQGRPLVAIIVASTLGLIAYAADSSAEGTVFDWLLAASGLSSIFTWGSICLAHIRFRRAWKVQGHTLDEIAFRSQPGVVGSWVGFIFNCLVLIVQFWVGAWPVGYASMTASRQLKSFFLSYLAAPIVLSCYAVYKFWKKTIIVRANEMDLQTGIRELNLPALIAEERAERAAWPKWKQLYKAQETVLGVYIFHRHGDRTSKSFTPTVLTDLGYSQVYASGNFYRNRYINASSSIYGISPDLVINSQLNVQAPVDLVLQSSAMGFLQGLYPAVGATLGTQTLADNTTVEAPLNGYQLIPVNAVASASSGANSENSAWLQGQSGCLNAITSSNDYFYSNEYVTLLNSTGPFYSSILPVINKTFTAAQDTFKNAYTIFDLIHVSEIHNASIPSSNLLTPETLFQLQTLADNHEFNLAYNSSEPIRAIAGSTLAAQILQQLNSTITGKSHSQIGIQFGAYASFLSFFGLAQLPAASVNFTGIVDYASAMTFELVTNATVTSTSYPSTDDISVRFLFSNGSASDHPLTTYPLFGQQETVIPWTTFASEMGKFAIGDQATWCSQCGNTTGVCASTATSSSSSPSSTSSGSAQKSTNDGGVSRAVAGVIGAMVTLAVVLGVEALVMLLAGWRLVGRKSAATPAGGEDTVSAVGKA